MEKLQGIVTEITFQNEDTGFTIIHLKTDSIQKQTCLGILPTVAVGESIVVRGSWKIHKSFGRQFEIKEYELIRPTTIEGISMLLGSGLISNIGPVRAKKIIDTFGLSTLDVLDNEPNRLREVPGIGEKIFLKICEAWEKQKHLKELLLFLQSYGVTVNLALKIYKTYGVEAKSRICENPYALVEDVWGVGFIKADQIAQKMGFSHDSYKRIRAGIIFIMQEACGNGHVFLNHQELYAKAAEILNISQEIAIYSLDHAVEAKILIKEDDCVYLPPYYNAEKIVSEKINNRIMNINSRFNIKLIDNWIECYNKNSSLKLDVRQIEAVKKGLSNSLFLLTGGPGTGKTTILQIIVSFFKEQGSKVILAAPTGRAAQRMGTVANLTALTLHRLLEFKPSESGYHFQKNEQNTIEADVVIIDESSMMDLMLMKGFLLALNPETILILVGDNNQLPSVGAGNVLADLIISNQIPHVHLTTIFRQAAQSRIVTAAHEIINGTVPRFQNSRTDNCFLILQDDPQKCLDTIIDLASSRLPKSYNLEPINDIQVLSPMHKGILGTEQLNRSLQSKLNPNVQRIIKGQNAYILGDKVMQIRNNYDLGVFNGDIGNIVEMDTEEGLTVEFENRKVHYELSSIEEIVPAYCISIHKSQGCEFKAVILPVSTQHYIMLQRNLIYTALTRAKKLCVLVGTQKALSVAIKNNNALLRNSRLHKLIVNI